MSNHPLRIGILSTARIARSFVQAVRPSQQVSVSAIASRSASKAQSFANELNIPRPFGSYAELLADPEIDAIYNPLPNSLHAEWSIRALRAGKHVLCEKPLAVSGAEALAMFEAARSGGVHLAEGYPYLAQPQTLKLRELLAAGTIGELRLIQASFGFTLSNPEDIRLDASLGGGALMDLGTYCVSLIRALAGQRPTRVNATAHWSKESGPDGAVDRTIAATIEFGSALKAQVTCSFDACLHRQALIVGSAGTVQTTFLNHTSATAPGSLALRVGTDAKALDTVVQTATANGFLAEAESFAALVQRGPEHWSGATPHESVDIAMTLEAILRSARERKTIDLAAPP
jgi:D-xylose 1-dehydrogenase (NADP+, D-xylono-1,5-lactone-forming)